MIPVPIFVNYVVNKKRRIINISNIRRHLGNGCSRAIPALHAFTGNDYTSAFYGVGKAKAFKILRDSEEFINTFSKLGKSFTLDSSLFSSLELFVCTLYGEKCSNINEARYKKFCSTKKCPEPQKLPPTRDALLCHSKRVSYVTAVIKRALEREPSIPNPDGYGWKLKNGQLIIDWMLLPIAPPDVVNMISCSCKKSKCSTHSCVCFTHGLKCTDLCGCIEETCENNAHQQDNEEDETDDEVDNEDELL